MNKILGFLFLGLTASSHSYVDRQVIFEKINDAHAVVQDETEKECLKFAKKYAKIASRHLAPEGIELLRTWAELSARSVKYLNNNDLTDEEREIDNALEDLLEDKYVEYFPSKEMDHALIFVGSAGVDDYRRTFFDRDVMGGINR